MTGTPVDARTSSTRSALTETSTMTAPTPAAVAIVVVLAAGNVGLSGTRTAPARRAARAPMYPTALLPASTATAVRPGASRRRTSVAQTRDSTSTSPKVQV